MEMKHTLTEWERENVIRLKEACDEEGIKYNSIFELAKFVLVTKSVAKDGDKNADKKRTKAALKRITKRREWEASLVAFDTMDPLVAIQAIEEDSPGFMFAIRAPDKDGRNVVGIDTSNAPFEFTAASPENATMFFVAEQYRLDLAAADLEEARRGIALMPVTNGKMTSGRALTFLRHLTKFGNQNVKEMHSHRVKKIYAEVPSLFVPLVGVAKKALPSKIADRISITGNVDKLMEKYFEGAQDGEEGLLLDPYTWAADRQRVFEETVNMVTLEPGGIHSYW